MKENRKNISNAIEELEKNQDLTPVKNIMKKLETEAEKSMTDKSWLDNLFGGFINHLNNKSNKE